MQSPTTDLAIDLESAYEACREITRREAKNFYYAFLTLPAAKRRAIYAASKSIAKSVVGDCIGPCR